MNNIEKLREHVAETCKRLERKEIGSEEAMAVSRAASAVIGSLRVEIQYRQARAEKPEIRYFEQNTEGLASTAGTEIPKP
jgi:hypothetical protein